MQNASTALARVPLSNTSDCQVAASQNVDSFSELNPVNLAAYANRVQKSGIDILHYPSDMTSYSGYMPMPSQNSDSPSKFNCPIDLAVSTPQDQSRRSELLSSNDPVNLAAYARKQPDYNGPSSLSVNEMSATPVQSSSHGNQSVASLTHSTVQTLSTDIKSDCASSTSVQPAACQNTPAVIRTLAAVSSSLTQQSGAYPHSLGLTNSLPPSYAHLAQWRPVLSPRTAQLVANAVSTPGQPLRADNTLKECERNPLLLQLQTAQLQALLQGFPPTSSAQCQSTASLATRRQFACNICGKMLSSQHNLRLHEATIHRGLFQFHCPICNKGLRQERDLRGHLANRHDWKKEFRCSICGHEFGYKRNLKHHVMSHHGISSLDE